MKKLFILIFVILILAFTYACSPPDNIPEIQSTPEINLQTPEPIIQTTPEPVFYTVIINLNYDDVKTIESEFKENSTIADISIPEREGFIFTHWSTSEDGENELSLDSLILEDMNVYAQWQMDLSPEALKLLENGYLMIENNTGLWNHEAAGAIFPDPHFVFVTERGAELIADGNVFIPFTRDPYETNGIFVTERAATAMLISSAYYYKDNPDDMYCTLGVLVTDDWWKDLFDDGDYLYCDNPNIDSINYYRYSQFGAFGLTPRQVRSTGSPKRGAFWWRPSSDPIIINYE